MSKVTGPPRLLVSVRNVEEARSALLGGADIIDVKEPARGSLGRADADVTAAIASLPEVIDSAAPLSAALGEVHEIRPQDVVPLSSSVRFAKLGFARLRYDAEWIARWVAVRDAYNRAAASPLGWIAVIYADALNAQSPTPQAVIAAAASTGCAGVLVDTFSKTSGQLQTYAHPRLLAQWARAVQTRDMMFAIAGRLSAHHLPCLAPVSPDVIAVRSAVCEGEDRLAAVSSQCVASFKLAMRRSWEDSLGR